MIAAMHGQPLLSITPDRVREFRLQPVESGTNENTNGLLREYFSKCYDFGNLSEEDLQAVIDQPRGCW